MTKQVSFIATRASSDLSIHDSTVMARAASAAAGSRTSMIEAQRAAEREALRSAKLIITPIWKEVELKEVLRQSPGTGTETQNGRVLRAFRKVGSLTRMEMLRFLDVQHGPARVLGLRQAGHNISGVWVRQLSEHGVSHRTMQYTLVGVSQDSGVPT